MYKEEEEDSKEIVENIYQLIYKHENNHFYITILSL